MTDPNKTNLLGITVTPPTPKPTNWVFVLKDPKCGTYTTTYERPVTLDDVRLLLAGMIFDDLKYVIGGISYAHIAALAAMQALPDGDGSQHRRLLQSMGAKL